MRLYLTILVLMISIKCFAQKEIPANEIKKINLIDIQWSPTGISRQTSFEIFKGDSSWLCYQTKQLYRGDGMLLEKLKNAEYLKKEISDDRKFVKKINSQTIDSLLKTITVIKPTINYNAFGIKPAIVINNPGSIFPENVSNKFTSQHSKIITKAIKNKQHIHRAIDYLVFHDFWTDDYPTCVIEIILKNNDTTKIVSRQQMEYMMPWTINKIKSFDININHFFINATGDYLYSNKYRLSGSGMPRKIYQYIYENYAHKQLIEFDWKMLHPNLYKKITGNFKIDYKPYRGFKLTVSQMRPNFYFDANLNIGDSTAVNWLVNYKDTIVQSYKVDNFVFKYYRYDENASIVFGFLRSAPFKYPGSYYRGRNPFKEWLALKENKNYNIDNIIRFTVEKLDGKNETWLILPDNKLVLVSHRDAIAAGISDEKLNSTSSTFADCLIVFDNTGKILSQYKW
ncbi:MAG: hypothetical protein ACXVAY_11010 [Mucilaginibacter sp.]